MVLRITVVVIVLSLIMLAQVEATRVGGPPEGEPAAALGLFDRHFGSVAIADNHDDNDDGDNDDLDNDDLDNESDDEDLDNDGDDNEDLDNEDGDNEDLDNDSDDNDGGDNEDIVIENLSLEAAPAEAVLAVPLVTQASGISTGAGSTIALPDNRIVVTMFPSMPPGITLTLRPVDPLTAPAAPGIRAGDLIFALEARDSTGAMLATLPAEINLDVTYSERDVAGLNDQAVTLSWLDPIDNQWKTAPKLVTNPAFNTVAASITQLGMYVVSVR